MNSYPQSSAKQAVSDKLVRYTGSRKCAICSDQRRFKLNSEYLCSTCFGDGEVPPITSSKIKSAETKHNFIMNQKKNQIGGIPRVFSGWRS